MIAGIESDSLVIDPVETDVVLFSAFGHGPNLDRYWKLAKLSRSPIGRIDVGLIGTL